jgi:predicted glycoside hydrolase/deacetylase ChbG (UPF0249 family)
VLIVNADDWGRTTAETDAALACFSQGRVTSVTAMTFMADSGRAAAIARERNVPVGLHLNFAEPLTAPGVDRAILSEHRGLAQILARTRHSAFVPNPFLRGALRRAFRSQLNEFVRLYQKPPTHFDGHRHLHLGMSMLIAAPIPSGQKVRRTFSFTLQEKGLANWLYRRALDRWVVARYRTTDYLFSLSQHMTDARFARVTQLAREATVELITHPIVAAERTFLLSDGFERQMVGVARKSYADLSVTRE